MPGLSRARELRQKRAALIEKARDIRDEAKEEDRDLTASEQERIEEILNDADELREQFEEIEAREDRLQEHLDDLDFDAQVEGAREAFADGEDEDTRTFDEDYERRLWTPTDNGGFPVEKKREDERYRQFESFVRGQEQRAGQMSVGTSGQGGVLVPEGFVPQFREALKDFGGMRRSRATVIATDMGNDLPVPTVDDTGNQGAWTSEGSTASGGSTHIPVSNVTLQAHKVTSGPILVSFELLDDSGIDVVGLVRNKLEERIGETAEVAYATGSGSGQPTGVDAATTGAVVVNYSASSTNLDRKAVLDLKHNVDPAYRRRGAEWMFSDNTLKDLALLEDADGRPLLQLGQENRAADRLMGHPYIINQEIDDFGSSGNQPIFFGDFSAYHIRDVNEMRLLRLNERYAEQGNVGFIGFFRTDGLTASATTDPAQRPIRCIIQNT